MIVEERLISTITPYHKNPRIISAAALDAIAASIKEFGFRQPIVVDENGVIIVGHGRYWAALKLGLEKVPVHVPVGWSPAKIKAYRIADNKTAELSSWNYELLPLELAELQSMDYDLHLLGFDPIELAQLLDPGLKNGLCDPDELPAAPDQAITRPGDLWLLGEHRLLCGDSANAADVEAWSTANRFTSPSAIRRTT